MARLVVYYRQIGHFPTRGELASRFDSPRSGGGPRWKGWMIRCPGGQAVRAVDAGQIVAQAGASGGGQETGVYFEIRIQGEAVDPAWWIAP